MLWVYLKALALTTQPHTGHVITLFPGNSYMARTSLLLDPLSGSLSLALPALRFHTSLLLQIQVSSKPSLVPQSLSELYYSIYINNRLHTYTGPQLKPTVIIILSLTTLNIGVSHR